MANCYALPLPEITKICTMTIHIISQIQYIDTVLWFHHIEGIVFEIFPLIFYSVFSTQGYPFLGGMSHAQIVRVGVHGPCW